MTDSKNSSDGKPQIPSLGSIKSPGAPSKLPKLQGPNLIGLKPLSVSGAASSGTAPSSTGVPKIVRPPLGKPLSTTSLTPKPIIVGSKKETAAAAPKLPEPVISETPEPVIPEAPEPVIPEAPEPVIPEAPEPVIPEAPEPVIPEAPEPVIMNETIPVMDSVVPPTSAPLADSSIDPNADDDELKWEDDEENNGEKTMMLEVPMDEDEDDCDGEKTQIQMDAAEYDPLSGKLIVEAGMSQQREYILVRDKTMVGRSQKNEIVVQDGSISRHHFSIEKLREGFRVVDQESANGTFLNGRRIRSGQLRDGDTLEIGNLRFRFEQTGGDPDDLWRGAAVVDYHPNQSRAHSTAGRAPSSQANAAVSAAPAPAQTSPAQPYGAPQQQSETMLQRANGGIAAPQWQVPPSIPVSPMTSPYMMSYAGNMQKNTATPMWALITVSIAAFLCLGSLIWMIIGIKHSHDLEDQAKAQANLVKDLNEKITEAVNVYAQVDIDRSREIFRKASDISVEGANELIEKYLDILDDESQMSKNILTINRQHRNMKARELEEAISVLRNVSENSVFYDQVNPAMIDTLNNAYINTLSSDVRSNVRNEQFEEARKLVGKISLVEHPNAEAKVKELNKYIDDNEKRK